MGLGMGLKLLPQGKSPSPPSAKVAVGHPRPSRALGSPCSMPGKLGPRWGSWLVLWLLVVCHGPAGLRVAEAGWRPRVSGEKAWDGGQSGCEEPVQGAAKGLYHRLPLLAGSAGPWEQPPWGRDISAPWRAGGHP